MVEQIGPYRVHERLGVGGMGEVYKAYDDRLDRWVAIKRIRPDRIDSEDNRERFKREARATAKLNHPSIVHLYGIFQEDESDCIVMEYVEGQTLDRLLASGPLDAHRVASLGFEISSGLAEAHSNGILHRDLKAENIIITRKGRAKILDFGLAKPLLEKELDPMLTGKGQLVGTSRAMSPEYVGGDAIDHRSDLFSLGVLLYEAATGKSPFKAHNTLATLKQVMLHKQTPVSEINGGVPLEMSELIDRLLAKEPEKRPQSAEEVADEFGHILAQISTGSIDVSTATAAVRGSTGSGGTSTTVAPFSASETVLDLRAPRRWIPIVSVLAVLILGAFLLGYFLQQPGRDPIPEGEVIQIVLGEFENNTQEEQFEKTLAQAFRVGLEQSRAIQALPPSQIREALQRMERTPETELDRDTAVEIARRENAEGVVLGSISQVGSQFVITADVVNPEDDRSWHTAKEFARGKEDVLNAIDALTLDVRAFLGESSEAIQRDSVPLERVTTDRIEALEAYTRGVHLFNEGKSDAALQFFLKAITVDPGFAMAHAKLVVIYSNRGDKAAAQRHVELALAKSERLTELEEFYVEGWAARWRGSPKEVLEVWSLMSEFHPESFAAHFNLGLSYWYYFMDFSSALSAFERAIDLTTTEDEFQLCSWHLGYSSLALGDTDSAETNFANLEDSERSSALFSIARVRLDFEQAEELLSGDSDNSDLYYEALLALDRGETQRSLGLFRTLLDRLLLTTSPGLTQEKGHALLGILVAMDYPKGGQVPPILGELDRVSPFAVDGRPETSFVSLVALVGKLEARGGELERAKRRLALLNEPSVPLSPISQAFVKMLEAEISLAAGSEVDKEIADIEAILGRTDIWQLRETYYRLLVQAGQDDLSEEQAKRLLERRHRAVVECIDQCFGQSVSAALWRQLESEQR